MDYPYPSVPEGELEILTRKVNGLHRNELASFAFMQMTVREASWYLRSMEELMMDMMMEDEKAAALLDLITQIAVSKATCYAKAGVDILNPIQSECMSFNEVHDLYGGRLLFRGILGTQELLPFGTKEF